MPDPLGSTPRYALLEAIDAAETLDAALERVEDHIREKQDLAFFAVDGGGTGPPVARLIRERETERRGGPPLGCFLESLKAPDAGPAWTAALLARILARARDDREVLTRNDSSAVVNGLCERHPLAGGFDAYGRWFPELRSAPNERAAVPHLPRGHGLREPAVRRLAAVHEVRTLTGEAQGTGAVLFPTTRDASDGSAGCLFEVRLRRLPDRVQMDRSLLLSPVSTYYLHGERSPDGCAELAASLEPTLRQVLGLQDAQPLPRFLVEIGLPEGLERDHVLLGGPPSIDVRIDGRSLGLAVVLAAWAAAKRRYLRRLCVTGVVEDNRLPAGRTAGGAAKLKAFRLYRDGVALPPARRPQLFLAPADALPPGEASAADVVALPESSLGLFLEGDAARFLTDGFDVYRAQLLEAPYAPPPEPYLIEDETYYGAAVASCLATIREGRSSRSAVSCPHGADPVWAVRWIVAALARESVRAAPHEVAALPVALPLALHPLDGSSIADRIGEALWRLWPPVEGGVPGCGGDGWIDREIVAEVVAQRPEKLLLVVFSRPASECRFGELPGPADNQDPCTEGGALKRLVEEVGAAGLFLVASNDSHLKFLEKAAELLGSPIAVAEWT